LNQKIKLQEGKDKFCWGYKSGGCFNLKEAYHLIEGKIEQLQQDIWDKIWKTNLWLRKILTWDNLIRKGFHETTFCSLCIHEGEITEYLLNSFSFPTTLWDQGSITFNTSYCNRSNLIETIEQWRIAAFSNPILNCAWKTFLGFLV
jgi:hypothetical protein